MINLKELSVNIDTTRSPNWYNDWRALNRSIDYARLIRRDFNVGARYSTPSALIEFEIDLYVRGIIKFQR